MKKLGVLILSGLFILTACEHLSEEDQIQQTEVKVRNFTFSKDEVDSLILIKSGNADLSFDEKTKLLMDHIVTLVWVNSREVTESVNGRTQTVWPYILCTAGTYFSNTQQWVFTTSEGPSSLVVQAWKGDNFDMPQEVGSSASIYGGSNGTHYTELLDINSVWPTYFDCGGDYISTTANSTWTPQGGAIAYASVDCDD